MPFTAFLHTHTLVVILYVLLFTVKVYLLFTNSNDILELVRRKTKIIDMILGLLIIITGVYMAFHSAASGETWFYIKLALFLTAVALGVIGFKRSNKVLAGIALLCFISVLLLSYLKPGSAFAHPANTIETESENDPASESSPADQGKELYRTANCISCHGDDGSLGLSGAGDLRKSTLSNEEIKAIITNGKNLMPPYRNQFTEDQLNALVTYVKSLRE